MLLKHPFHTLMHHRRKEESHFWWFLLTDMNISLSNVMASVDWNDGGGNIFIFLDQCPKGDCIDSILKTQFNNIVACF